MQWSEVTQPEDLDAILEASSTRPQIVLKHSHRCPISGGAKSRLEQQAAHFGHDAEFRLLNVVDHRPVSQDAAERFGVHHESPQLIVLKDGEAILEQSHHDVTLEEVAEVLDTSA